MFSTGLFLIFEQANQNHADIRGKFPAVSVYNVIKFMRSIPQ